MAVVVVTHEMESVKVIADRITMLVPRRPAAPRSPSQGTYEEMLASEDPDVRDFVLREPLREPRAEAARDPEAARRRGVGGADDHRHAARRTAAGSRLYDELGRGNFAFRPARVRALERPWRGGVRHALRVREARRAGKGRPGLRGSLPPRREAGSWEGCPGADPGARRGRRSEATSRARATTSGRSSWPPPSSRPRTCAWLTELGVQDSKAATDGRCSVSRACFSTGCRTPSGCSNPRSTTRPGPRSGTSIAFSERSTPKCSTRSSPRRARPTRRPASWSTGSATPSTCAAISAPAAKRPPLHHADAG